jgi:hypothetical protein
MSSLLFEIEYDSTTELTWSKYRIDPVDEKALWLFFQSNDVQSKMQKLNRTMETVY